MYLGWKGDEREGRERKGDIEGEERKGREREKITGWRLGKTEVESEKGKIKEEKEKKYWNVKSKEKGTTTTKYCPGKT